MRESARALAAGLVEWAPDEKGRFTRWKGGYIEHGANGVPTYYIRKMVEGVAYDISTRTHSIAPALLWGVFTFARHVPGGTAAVAAALR